MTLDTNILIAYLNGENVIQDALTEWKQSNRPLFISSISVAEILALSALTPEENRSIKQFLSGFITVPFDNQLAEVVAVMRRTYGLRIPDAAIAATALMRNVPLVSRDHDFLKIKELTVLEI